jgi:hypothetical protein
LPRETTFSLFQATAAEGGLRMPATSPYVGLEELQARTGICTGQSRYVIRGGERILQQLWQVHNQAEWRDVPTVEEIATQQ